MQSLSGEYRRCTMDGMRVIVDRLRRYGGMEAWRLASEIEEKLGNNHASG